MTELVKRLEADYLTAVKQKDQAKVDIYRLLKSALKNEEIEKRTDRSQLDGLNEEDVIKVLKKEAKKRQEAIQLYTSGGRDDLRKKEESELSIIKEYLPSELADEEIKNIVKKVIQDNSLSQQDFGQAMKLVMAELKGQADGKRVGLIVKELL